MAFEKNEEALAAYQDGRCDVYTTDQSGLYAERLKLPNPDEQRGAARDHLQGAAGPRRAPG